MKFPRTRLAGLVVLTAIACASAQPVTALPISQLPASNGPIGFAVTLASGGSITSSPITYSLNGGVPNSAVQVKLRAVGSSSTVIVASGTTDGSGAFSATSYLPSSLAAGNYELLSSGAAVGSTDQVIATFSVASTSILTNTSVVDGALQLITTSQTVATFGTPTLVNNRSETAGALGAFTVKDDRLVSKPGWTLTANVSTFTNSADPSQTISSSNLAIAPTQALGSTAPGVSIFATSAGSASYPYTFAEAPAGGGDGLTLLSAALLLVSPQAAPAGTYTSTLTLTLVSK